ncbi:MAG: mannitol dehydrogenase family protein [Alphaproteobacteria bacterium]|jgi:fructuronate reductase|nr:mannitol dehydrogenase family protein [Alphaproteobacteria bacterium]
MGEIKANAGVVKLPTYNYKEMQKNTKENPKWIHFGGGNLYRCFHAKVMHDLLENHLENTGIVVVETFGKDLVKEYYQAYNNQSLSVVMKADGSLENELITATADVLYLSKEDEFVNNYQHLKDYFTKPSLQLVSLTITEKGYALKDSHENLLPKAIADIKTTNILELQTTMGILAGLLYLRYKAKVKPIAVVSTDNFSHNGDRLRNAIAIIVKGWAENKLVEADFIDWVLNKVSYPFSMIDRITPSPSKVVAEQLKNMGIKGIEPFKSSGGIELAAFVNTEEVHYLVIEDSFPNGRPSMEKAGVILTDRDTVNKVDLMKVCSCLNPLHTALAIFGCLLGFNKIYDEVQDKDLLALIKKIGYDESLPVVEDPKIINPKNFIDTVINIRFANPNIPDTPQRIATDTSQKISIRFGETIKKYVKLNKVESLEFIPLVIAGWLRYLLGVDDKGNTMQLSPDPLLSELQAQLSEIKLGVELSSQKVHEILKPILSNSNIFGSDLVAIGLNSKIESNFISLIKYPNAVRETLQNKLATK